MNRALFPLALVTALAACSQGPRPGRDLRPTANPSAVIAAELAFAQLAQDKGQWAAFGQTATPDAVMFVPQPIQAQAFLRGKANPAVAVKWQPHQVWSSCDGSVAITHGAWQGPRGVGYFTTVWQRQRDGGYKWLFDHGDTLALPLDAPEMITAKVAECPPRRPGPPPSPAASAPFDPASRSGRSDDGTLIWTVTAQPDGAHNFSAEMTTGGAMTPVVIEEVSAQR